MQGTVNFSQKEEVLKFISENNCRILNLCHIPEEGRLKVLSFSTANRDRMMDVLEYGERVDGSSLFSSIEAGKSDIYIFPRISRAFADPFAVLPTLNILCDYLDERGKPLAVAPQTVLAQAQNDLKNSTGVVLRALAELEFFIISRQQPESLFQSPADKNYHECSPFSKFEEIQNEILATLSVIGVPTKYGHSEVGRFTQVDGTVFEQHEIEFMPLRTDEMAEIIAISKWAIRNICLRHNVAASFIPKVDMDHAGNGMHIHLCGFKRDKNIIVGADRELSKEGCSMIGGILKLAQSLAAFGNPTPISYLRFIARKESPMHVCWSAQNRLALIRIPLWWKFRKKMSGRETCRETFEYRASDAFANPSLLFAGLTAAAEWGLKNFDDSTAIARKLHAKSFRTDERRFRTLPQSCSETAENLKRDRKFYEAGGVFPAELIDSIINRLSSYQDRNLVKKMLKKPEQLQNLTNQYLDYA
jgi:glutamine synthetase